ncbi:MAG: Crp/Fnr family transcriptional regulator, partial [Bacteroidales bacterium]|nr:Crp/Fnr family transcriptional regulator [Bacteroidales bacterium]
LLATEERLISMLSAIASERYKELLEKEPDLLQRLPLGSIATYLGVTQTSLSRIRAKITRP